MLSTLGSGRQTSAWTPGGLSTQGESASQSELDWQAEDPEGHLKPPLRPAPPGRTVLVQDVSSQRVLPPLRFAGWLRSRQQERGSRSSTRRARLS